MAAPEGDFWFHHDALKSEHFDPTNPKQFYTTIWLEIATSQSLEEAHEYAPPIPWELHPRADLQILAGGALRTTYDRYKYLTAMVGSSNKHISRYKKVHGTASRDDLTRQSEKHVVKFVPVDMPTADERYLWVDLSYPLRGIYFPRRHIAQPKYPRWCMYSRINFTRRNVTLKSFANPRPPPPGRWEKKQIFDERRKKGETRGKIHSELNQMKIPPATFPDEKLVEGSVTINTHRYVGWNTRVNWTARFDVKHIMHILTLPRDWLKEEFDDPYKHIALYDCRYLDLIGNESYSMDSHGVDLTKVLKEEYGVPVTYKESGFDRFWVVKTLGGLVLVGVSLIPGYGPILAFGSQMLLDLFTDPDIFTAQKFSSDRLPVATAAGYAQAGEVKTLVAQSAKDAKLYLNPRLLDKLVRLAGKGH